MSEPTYAAVVLCAGRGTRLGELGRDRPKAMLLFRGRPLLHYTLTNLHRAGVREVGINVCHHAEQIREYVGDGSAWGLKVELAQESEPSGTAGGFRCFGPLLARHAGAIVHYGDVLTNADLRALVAFHRAHGRLASLLLHRSTSSNSVVDIDPAGAVSRFLERPPAAERAQFGAAWTNSGIYCLQSEVAALIPTAPVADFPADVFPGLVRRGELYGLPLVGKRWAIDTESRYHEANEAMTDDFI